MLEIRSNINWLIGPLACASLNTAKTIPPFQRSEILWSQSRKIIINLLFDDFIEKCMFLGSFKPNLNIKGEKGSKKREKGDMYHLCKKKKKQFLEIPKEMFKMARNELFYSHTCVSFLKQYLILYLLAVLSQIKIWWSKKMCALSLKIPSRDF